jgi:hypothetical protein
MLTVHLAFAAAAALITVAVMSLVSNALNVYTQARPVSIYAEDRAEIEDLQARYLFALDFHDPGSGDVKGREAIKAVIAKMPARPRRQAFEPQPLDTTSRTASSRLTATKRPDARIGFTTPTTTHNARESSMGSGTMRTNWSRPMGNGCSQSERSTTKAVMSGPTRAARIPLSVLTLGRLIG